MGNDLPGIAGPGVAPRKIEELETAVEEYVRERDRRMAVTPDEVRTKKKVIDLLHQYEAIIGRDAKGVLRYQCGDQVLELRPGKEKLRVKAADDDDDDGNGDEGEE